MIPIQDVIPTRTRPWVTVSVIAAIALVWLAGWLLPDLALGGFVREVEVSRGPRFWLDLPAALLIHTGVIHAGSNMLALWLFGPTVEDRLDRPRYGLLLAVGAVASVLPLRWPHADVVAPLAGTAGAVAAVIGAYLALWPRSRVLVLIPIPRYLDLVEIPAVVVPGFWGLLQMLAVAGPSARPSEAALTVAGSIATSAIAGAIAGRVLVRADRLRVDWWSGEAI